MKKTHSVTLTSQPICVQALSGKGHQSIVDGAKMATEALAEMISELVPQMKIEFVNQADEETPCNLDRTLFYLRISMSLTK